MRHKLPLLLVLALAACKGAPQDLTVTMIAPGADTLHVPGADATQAAWLGGRRWAVASPSTSAVSIVDFSARTVTPLGVAPARTLQHPSTIFLAGDTLFVNDWGLRATTVWTPDGKLVRSMPAPDITAGTLPQAIDGAGRSYYEIAPPPRRDGSAGRDSAAVVRLTAGADRTDTIARLGPLDLVEVNGDAGRRFERRVLSGQDAWGVLPDGAMWIGRVYHNRVDWVGPDGKTKRGRQLPDRIIEVTRTDRELFYRRFPAELRSTAEQLPFAPIKPPFEAAFGGPAGMVWLEKSQSPADTVRRYHIVGRDGEPAREVQLRGYWGRILGVNATTALIADPDSTGFRMSEVALPAR